MIYFIIEGRGNVYCLCCYLFLCLCLCFLLLMKIILMFMVSVVFEGYDGIFCFVEVICYVDVCGLFIIKGYMDVGGL